MPQISPPPRPFKRLLAPLVATLPFAGPAASLRASDLDLALEAWRTTYGENWELDVDPRTDFGVFLYSGIARPVRRPEDDAGVVEAATEFVRASQALHGIRPETLVFDRLVFLPLSLFESSDKTTIRFRQVIDGVPVEGGGVNVLVDSSEGFLLSVYSSALPAVDTFDTEPSLPAETARALAAQQLLLDTGISAEGTGPAELVITRIDDGTSRIPILAWRVRAFSWREGAGLSPVAFDYWIDAETTELIRARDAVKHFDVTGTVTSLVTKDAGALHSSSLIESKPMGYIFVDYDDGQGNTGTEQAGANGQFTILGVDPPVDVTIRYEGAVTSRITDATGPEYEQTFTLQSTTGNAIEMVPFPNPPEADIAQANAYYWIVQMHDWVQTTNPADSIWSVFHFANQPTAEVHAQGNICNGAVHSSAYELILYTSAGSDCQSNWTACNDPDPCTNTASATWVAHEFGHLLYGLYGFPPSGAGSLDEGTADVFALYLTDQVEFAKDICLDQDHCGGRRGDNARRYCIDGQTLGFDNCNPGSPHAGGEVLMGAYWKMRERLTASQGAMGEYAADALFNAWLNAYAADVEGIDPIIRTQLLTLDDVPGGQGLRDGTPHWADIDLGFAEHAFPRHKFMESGIHFSNLTDPGVTADETGPYTVSAYIKANFAPPIQSASLHYRVNGGTFQPPVSMTPSGNTFTGTIPGQTAPAVIEYYLSATDSVVAGSSTGQTAEHPVKISVALSTTQDQLLDPTEMRYENSEATPVYERFFVGVKEVLFEEDFDPQAHQDWTNGGSFNDWQVAQPAGLGGSSGGVAWSDPSAAFDGLNCAGNDLLGVAPRLGAYEPNADNYLQSPEIVLTCLSPGDRTFLRFQRWLSVDDWRTPAPPHDAAEIGILTYDGQSWAAEPEVVWRNHREVTHIDNATSSGAWMPFEIEISGFLNGATMAKVEWALHSNSNGKVYGGWAVDDVEVFAIRTETCD